MMAVWKIAPALAAGCTVVLKPAEQTPLTALLLGELSSRRASPPASSTSSPATARPAPRWSTTRTSTRSRSPARPRSARRSSEASAGNLKRVTLELGGKSPVIVFPDADLERAIDGAASGIFFNSGQVLRGGLPPVRAPGDLRPGGRRHRRPRPQAEGRPGHRRRQRDGPARLQEQFERVSGYIESGARTAPGPSPAASRIDRPGYFVEPTVLDRHERRDEDRARGDLRPGDRVVAFSDADLDRIAGEANDTTYGLAATSGPRTSAPRTGWREAQGRHGPRQRRPRPRTCRSAGSSSPAGAARTAAWRSRRSPR